MRRRTKLVLWFGTTLALVALAWCLVPGGAESVAGLSKDDVTQIRRKVRGDVWRSVFPSWSLSSLRALPWRARDAWRAEIKIVRCNPDGTVQAKVHYRPDLDAIYALARETNRWVLARGPLTIKW